MKTIIISDGRPLHRALCTLLLGIAALWAMPRSARAQVTDYPVFKEALLTQTTPAAPSLSDPATSWFFDSRIFLTNTGDATAASFTNSFNVTNGMSLISATPPTYDFRSSLFASQSALDAAYPNGAAYTLKISGGTLGTDSGTFSSQSTPLYPSAVPSFTNFDSIQHLNPNQPFTFTFSGFTGLTGAGESAYLFLIVSGPTGFSRGFLPPSTTSVQLPANTLLAGQNYSVSLDYSNRELTGDEGFVTSSGGVNPTAGYDYNTTVTFTTVPEPSAWWMMAGGGVALLGIMFRKKRRTA
jgi:hypothetical protein